MLSVTYKPLMLSVFILSVIRLNVVAPISHLHRLTNLSCSPLFPEYSLPVIMLRVSAQCHDTMSHNSTLIGVVCIVMLNVDVLSCPQATIQYRAYKSGTTLLAKQLR